jgi:ATP-binding cassette subfamily C protein
LRPHFVYVGLLSFFVNALYLASPLYMLQVYDHVLSSGSVTTLVFVTVILLVALATLGALDAVRARVLVLSGEVLDEALAGRLLSRVVEDARGDVGGRSALLREFDSLRSFFAGHGVLTFFDIPWTPIFIVVCALLHPWLGVLALAGSLAMLVVAYANERSMRAATAGAHESAARAHGSAECALEEAEAIKALGMREGVVGKWLEDRADHVSASAAVGRRAAGFSGTAKFLRFALQSGALGLGAYLAIDRQITPGAMIAGSIVVGRALAPLDQVFGTWRSAGLARGAFRRIREALRSAGARKSTLSHVSGRLQVDDLVVHAPDTGAAILKRVTLAVEPGELLGVVGASGAGKSTLARALTGAWPPNGGSVRLDGVELSQVDDCELGRCVGYLPQDAALLPGSVADNIARFDRYAPGADAEQVERDMLEAARAADAHELILSLPDGYDTEVGPGGRALSGGQRQRVALARALYGDPVLLVFDEPNAHLDSDGEAALLAALASAKRRRRSVVMITHRSLMLSQADSLILLRDGVVADAGRRDDVIRRLQGPLPLSALKSGTAA